MNSRDLKKIMKPLIRECLTEIFAEMKLESIVEGVVQKSSPLRGSSLGATLNSFTESETVENQRLTEERVAAKVEITGAEKKDMLKRRLGIDENEWRAMYQGTEPISDEDDGPELVSESALRQAGLMKDYSKFV